MIFSNDEIIQFELNGVSYPALCSLKVLDKIQDEIGDIIVAEDKLRGFVPHVDEDGVIDRTIGTFTFPSVSLVCKTLAWMLEEGKAVTDGSEEIPSFDDLQRQNEYSIFELQEIVLPAFEKCIAHPKKKKEAQKKTATKTQTRKR